MNREVTMRDLTVLGFFVTLLVVGSYAYIRWATAPASPGRPVAQTERTLERKGENLTPATDVAQVPLEEKASAPAISPKRDYHFIAERNIFQPSIEKPKEQVSTTPVRTLPPSGVLGAPPPLPVAPPPPPPTPQVAARPANLTATGIIRLGNESYVLLENPQTRDTALVRVGESAFGYQVASTGDNYVEVRQGDVAYRITLGEGKPERKVMAAAAPAVAARPPSAPPTPGGPPGGMDGGMGRRQGRGSADWALRVAERWGQIPESVRNRILERMGQIWQQMPPETQQQIMQRFREMGVSFTPPQ